LATHQRCHVDASLDSLKQNALLPVPRHWNIYRDGAKYLDRLYHHFNAQYIKKTRSCSAELEYGFPFDNKEQMLEIGEVSWSTSPKSL